MQPGGKNKAQHNNNNNHHSAPQQELTNKNEQLLYTNHRSMAVTVGRRGKGQRKSGSGNSNGNKKMRRTGRMAAAVCRCLSSASLLLLLLLLLPLGASDAWVMHTGSAATTANTNRGGGGGGGGLFSDATIASDGRSGAGAGRGRIAGGGRERCREWTLSCAASRSRSRHRCLIVARAARRQQGEGGGAGEGEEEAEQSRYNSDYNYNILEDKPGHVNRELAERIWNWEREHRARQALPNLDYSVRSGLRLVDRTAQEVLAGLRNNGEGSSRSGRKSAPESGDGGFSNNSSKGSMMYSDLVQEGLSSLLDAMGSYPGDDSDGFEAYARRRIFRRLAACAGQDATVAPPRSARFLPKSVRSVLREATRASAELKRRAGGTATPTIEQVAAELRRSSGGDSGGGVSAERLRDYVRLARRGLSALSVESTVEIFHPMLEDSPPAYRDEDSWELQEGMLLDNGRSVQRDQLVEGFLDESTRREGDDDSWIQQQEQVAGRLRDLIPDGDGYGGSPSSFSSSSPDDQVLMDMMNADLPGFLSSTLDDEELEVVRAKYGLGGGADDGKPSVGPLSRSEVAEAMGITQERVSSLLSGAIMKLRASYQDRYVEPYVADDNYSRDREDSV